MQTRIARRCDRRWSNSWITLVLLMVLPPLLLFSCSPSGDRVGDISSPSEPSPQVERQAIENLLALYREALQNEDIDRLQSLLSPDTPVAESQSRRTMSADSFRETIRATFQSCTILTHHLQDEVIAADRLSATFLEVLSSLAPHRSDASPPEQRTEVYRLTFSHRLAIEAQSETGETLSFDHHYLSRE